MTIKAKHDIGDYIYVDGKRCKIISMHIYESDHTHTERYYLGGGGLGNNRTKKKQKGAEQ